MSKYVWQASRWQDLSGSAKHEIFLGKWAIVSLAADSGAAHRLKNFSGKCRPPVRCSNFIQRCVLCPFQKGGSCKIVGRNRRACFAFFVVFPSAPWARLANNSRKIVSVNQPGNVGHGSPGQNLSNACRGHGEGLFK